MEMLEYLKAERQSLLEDVRQRLGAKDEDDDRFDNQINEMTPQEIVANWCGWTLGDNSWGNIIIGMYENITNATKEVE